MSNIFFMNSTAEIAIQYLNVENEIQSIVAASITFAPDGKIEWSQLHLMVDPVHSEQQGGVLKGTSLFC